MTQFGYLSFRLLFCIVKHSGVPLPALDSTQIKNVVWLSRTLVNVMEEYFPNEIVQSCGERYETAVNKNGLELPTSSYTVSLPICESSTFIVEASINASNIVNLYRDTYVL